MRLWIAALFVLSAFAGSLRSAEIEIALSSELSYGEPVALDVRLVNPKSKRGRLKLGPVDGLKIEGPSGPSQQYSSINGKSSVSLTYRYVLTPPPRKSGTFLIGPVTWTPSGPGPKLSSGRVRLKVYRRPPLAVKLSHELSSPSGIVKHPFRVTYTISYPLHSPATERAVRSLRELTAPLLNQGGARVKPVPSFSDRRSYPIDVRGKEVIFQENFVESKNGTAYATLVFAFEVTPLQVGELVINPTRAGMELRTGKTKVERSFFGDRRVAVTNTYRATSQTIRYRVTELPSEGQPAGFTGAVGRYKMSVSTEDTKVKTYDPNRLVVKVKGDGLLEELPVPDWNQIASLTKLFDVSRDVDAGDVNGDTKTYLQTLRAKSDEIREIPPLPFPYYDPRLGKYMVVYSEAIPIEVETSTTVGIDDTVINSGGPKAVELGKTNPVKLLATRGISAGSREIGPSREFVSVRAVLKSVPFLAVCSIPPLLFVFLLALVRAASRSPEQRAKNRAYGKAKSELGKAKDAEVVSSALQTYFQERLKLPPGEITPDQIRRDLTRRGLSSEPIDPAVRLIERLLASRFGGPIGSTNELRTEALSVLKELEKQQLDR
ncbi:MAG: BatD family protein [Planctomycetota bacterium]